MTDKQKKPPQGLTITPSSATLKPGDTLQLVCSHPQASWSSANTAIATVTSAGFVTAMSQAGATTIKAQYKADKGSMSVTVQVVPVDPPFTVTPETAELYPADTVQLIASKPSPTWVSSDVATVTVNASGLATGVAAGMASVTASVGSDQASMRVTVLKRNVPGGPYLTDTGVHVEPPLPTLAAAGDKIIDPVFKTEILRLTDAADGSDCWVEYAYWPSFNVNSTRVLAKCKVSGTNRTRFWDFNPLTMVRSGGTLMGMTLQSTDLIWSGSNPDVVYGNSQSRLLLSYNVVTGIETVLHDFTAVVPLGGHIAQMSASADDDVFAFTVQNSSFAPTGYLVWKRSTNRILLQQTNAALDEVQIDKSGRYLSVTDTSHDGKVWDLQPVTPTATNLVWGSGGFAHHDSGVGTLFSNVAVNNRPGFRHLAAPLTITQLTAQCCQAGRTMHYSLRAVDETYGLISDYNEDGSGVSLPFDNELWLVKTDGSGAVRRLAHHRSVFNDYDDAPFANISPDGRFVAFSSNWGNASGRRDVYIVRVPANDAW